MRFFYDNGVPATNGTRGSLIIARGLVFNAKPFRGGRRRVKSISVDFATGRRPGFDWVTPLVRPHAFHWEGLNILFRTATAYKSGIRKPQAARAIGRALFHKQEFQRAMIRWRAERHENDRGSSLSRVPW